MLAGLERKKSGYLLAAIGVVLALAAPDLNAIAVVLIVVGLVLAFA